MRSFVQKQNQPQKTNSTSLARSHTATPALHHRADLILNLQRTVGNQAVQRMLPTNAEESEARLTGTATPHLGHDFSRIPLHPPAAGAIQTKLAINKPGNEYEQEADRISEQVMRMPEPQLQRACACGGACPECQTEQPEHGHERLQTKRDGEQTEVPPIVHEVLRSPGQPIDSTIRAFMEPRFGHDFSQVRVHTDESAETSARMINAHAYAVGNDIVFGLGRFDSSATEGRRLLAHELTHVVQQTAGHAPRAVAQQAVEAGILRQKDEQKTTPPPTGPKCDPGAGAKCETGCAQRWGQDTTCSKWGFTAGVHEQGEGKRWKSFPCCNSWPWSLEDYARNQLSLNGAASCSVRHEKEIATITFGENKVEVLCSDTIPGFKFGVQAIGPVACPEPINCEVIEMSPQAMQDLSGQVVNPLPVSVCYSGSKQDLCLHNGPGPKRRTGRDAFPESFDCLTEGCTPQEGTPKLKDTGWRPT
jgi:hypothetical protein